MHGSMYCIHCGAKMQDAGPVGRKHLRQVHGIETDVMNWDMHFEKTKKLTKTRQTVIPNKGFGLL